MTMQNLKMPKLLQNASEAWNLKMLKSKMPNLKQLAFIGAMMLGLNICLADTNPANTNPLNDKKLVDYQKLIYYPQNRDELVQLLNDEKIEIDSINTRKITDMSFLFADVSSDECDRLAKDKSLAPYIQNCKNTASKRKGIKLMLIEFWNTSNVKDMSYMFYKAKSFNEPIGSWNVSNVENMAQMFAGAKFFNQNLDSWKINKDARTEDMFKGSPLESKPPKWYKE